jgi:hypothetical protein
MSVSLSVVCCQVEVSAKGRSPVQRSPAECVCVIKCDQVQQKPRNLQWVGRRGQTEGEINK